MEKVTLWYDGKGREFTPLHAQNILNIQADEHIAEKNCWILPADSPWKYENRMLSLNVQKAKANATSGGNKKA